MVEGWAGVQGSEHEGGLGALSWGRRKPNGNIYPERHNVICMQKAHWKVAAIKSRAVQVEKPGTCYIRRNGLLRLGKGEINSDWEDLGRRPGGRICLSSKTDLQRHRQKVMGTPWRLSVSTLNPQFLAQLELRAGFQCMFI